MTVNKMEVKQINQHEIGISGLAHLLMMIVEEGSSVGFLPPLKKTEAEKYWSSLMLDDICLFTAEINGEIAGTVQLHLSTKPNGLHRAEIAKLMTHPSFRNRGVARMLMEKAEQKAREEGRTLLILDTREGAPSNKLYLSLGYKEAGKIPSYALSADGSMHATILYYKQLADS
ncbi:GNAT family N-acetyltransferase [Bacillus sp. FJAT-42376]|uniref:GNAT family N-acetyltransferase n=1 Tax=Bacillus sp. FJAT-42376 TaxID=2014076 RepID=UPI000F516D96|nr:GNAT family N-acetyltransferase [Bacillus sp. FJAT-42376]AZB43873.1 GNAT family N-acetyltransferase [Bacillus sp. FJAT-42376]